MSDYNIKEVKFLSFDYRDWFIKDEDKHKAFGKKVGYLSISDSQNNIGFVDLYKSVKVIEIIFNHPVQICHTFILEFFDDVNGIHCENCISYEDGRKHSFESLLIPGDWTRTYNGRNLVIGSAIYKYIQNYKESLINAKIKS